MGTSRLVLAALPSAGGWRRDVCRAGSFEGDINLAGAELVREGGFWTLTVPGLGEVELVARRETPPFL
jgi:hypothetical protein